VPVLVVQTAIARSVALTFEHRCSRRWRKATASCSTRLLTGLVRARRGSLNRYVVPVARLFAGLRSQAYGKPPGFRVATSGSGARIRTRSRQGPQRSITYGEGIPHSREPCDVQVSLPRRAQA
jgi:hypothetical protein